MCIDLLLVGTGQNQKRDFNTVLNFYQETDLYSL